MERANDAFLRIVEEDMYMTDSEKLDFIITKVVSIDKKVEALEKRVSALEEKVGALEERMDSLEKRMDSLEKRMDSLEERMDSLEKRMDSLEERMDSLERRMDSVEKRLSIVEVALADDRRENRLTRSIIENEVNHSIKLIAEGHYDLNRKVDEAIHTTSDVAAKEEIYDLKFVIQGEKIREISERMDIYATN